MDCCSIHREQIQTRRHRRITKPQPFPLTGEGKVGTVGFVLRQLRVECPGAICHVMGCGDRRQHISVDEVDRPDFLHNLAHACIGAKKPSQGSLESEKFYPFCFK